MTEPHLSDPRKAKAKHDYQTCLLIQKNMTKFVFVYGYSKFVQSERKLLKLHLRGWAERKRCSNVLLLSFTFICLQDIDHVRHLLPPPQPPLKGLQKRLSFPITSKTEGVEIRWTSIFFHLNVERMKTGITSLIGRNQPSSSCLSFFCSFSFYLK